MDNETVVNRARCAPCHLFSVCVVLTAVEDVVPPGQLALLHRPPGQGGV